LLYINKYIDVRILCFCNNQGQRISFGDINERQTD